MKGQKQDITLAKVESIRKRLESLPEVKPSERHLSMRETVEALKPTISELRKRGYSIEAIASELSKDGVKVAASTLKLYAKGTKRKPRVNASKEGVDKK